MLMVSLSPNRIKSEEESVCFSRIRERFFDSFESASWASGKSPKQSLIFYPFPASILVGSASFVGDVVVGLCIWVLGCCCSILSPWKTMASSVQPIVIVRFFHLLLWIFLEEATVLQGEREFEFLMEYVILALWVYGVWVWDFGVWLEEVPLWSGVDSGVQLGNGGLMRERAAEIREREGVAELREKWDERE